MRNVKSQSLIHQVLDSHGDSSTAASSGFSSSQSLIHQVLDSHGREFWGVHAQFRDTEVAIPYSSGLRFSLFIRSA